MNVKIDCEFIGKEGENKIKVSLDEEIIYYDEMEEFLKFVYDFVRSFKEV